MNPCEWEKWNEKQEICFVTLTLDRIIRNKKYEYREIGIEFNCFFDLNDRYIIVNASQLNFEHMISNLIDNAVKTCDENSRTIEVLLSVESKKENKYIKISANNNTNCIGQSIHSACSNHSTCSTHSNHSNHTNSIKLPMIDCPTWMIKHLTFFKGDIIVILNDDLSVFSAFTKLLGDHSGNLAMKFFTKSRDAIDFIKSFPNKERIFFFCDYKLKSGNFSDITMTLILSGVKKDCIIILTSAYGHEDRNLHSIALNFGGKILLKQFLRDISIVVI